MYEYIPGTWKIIIHSNKSGQPISKPMHIHLPAEEAWSVFSGLGKFLRILPTDAADDLYWSLGNRRLKSFSVREIFSVHFCTKRSSSLSRSESSEDAAPLLASFLSGVSVKRGLEL